MNWITENWVNLLAAAGSVVTLASVVARMTPSTHDDEAVEFLLKIVQWLSINGAPKK